MIRPAIDLINNLYCKHLYKFYKSYDWTYGIQCHLCPLLVLFLFPFETDGIFFCILINIKITVFFPSICIQLLPWSEVRSKSHQYWIFNLALDEITAKPYILHNDFDFEFGIKCLHISNSRTKPVGLDFYFLNNSDGICFSEWNSCQKYTKISRSCFFSFNRGLSLKLFLFIIYQLKNYFKMCTYKRLARFDFFRLILVCAVIFPIYSSTKCMLSSLYAKGLG